MEPNADRTGAVFSVNANVSAKGGNAAQKREYDRVRAFRLEAPLTRVVATDYLVTVDTHRYSVPGSRMIGLIGQPVEVLRRDGFLQMRHRGQVVATHPVLGGRHQLRILPEHGPGPIARNARVVSDGLAARTRRKGTYSTA